MSGRSEPSTPLAFPTISFAPQNNLESTVLDLAQQLAFLNLGPASREEVNNLSTEILHLKNTLKEIMEDIRDVLLLKNLQSDLINVNALMEEEINKIQQSLNQQNLSSQLLNPQLSRWSRQLSELSNRSN